MNDILRLIFKIILLPLFLTIVIEGIAVFLITFKGNYFLASLICNLLTNPLLNGILMLISNKIAYIIVVAVLEICIVIGEALIYKGIVTECTLKRGVFVSFAANACSFLLGMLIL